MFLVRDRIPTEPVWTAFITAAAEASLKQPCPPAPTVTVPKLPRTGEPKVKYREPKWEAVPMPDVGAVPPVLKDVQGWLQDACRTRLTGAELYQAQDLYSIYVHRSPDAQAADKDSIFAGRDLPDRVRAGYAQPTLVAALRLLLRHAMRDPRNSKFVLVSEACVPLWHPVVIWAQLMAEGDISRVADDRRIRHSSSFAAGMRTNHFGTEHWAKSSQWVALSRVHADIVAYDEHVWPKMERYCRTTTDGSYTFICVADEYYVASVLAVYHQSDMTDNIGKNTYVDWKGIVGWHPRSFYPGNATESIGIMRAPDHRCPAPTASIKSAAALFNFKKMCHVGSSQALPLEGPHYRAPGDDGRAEVPSGQALLEAGAEGLQARQARRLQGDFDLKSVKEWMRSLALKERILGNLWMTQRLPGFEPMSMYCPLFGRRVVPEAVSEFAAVAWKCDGLGFALECLS